MSKHRDPMTREVAGGKDMHNAPKVKRAKNSTTGSPAAIRGKVKGTPKANQSRVGRY